MAKIVEDIIVIKFSKIIKNTDDPDVVVLTSDNAIALTQVAQELVGDGVVVEVERA
jgi:hypothetical protein